MAIGASQEQHSFHAMKFQNVPMLNPSWVAIFAYRIADFAEEEIAYNCKFS